MYFCVPSNQTLATPLVLSVVSWRRRVVGSVVRRMNEVTLRQARLILGWVTVFGRVIFITVRNQHRSTQPCIPSGSLNRVPASQLRLW